MADVSTADLESGINLYTNPSIDSSTTSLPTIVDIPISPPVKTLNPPSHQNAYVWL